MIKEEFKKSDLQYCVQKKSPGVFRRVVGKT